MSHFENAAIFFITFVINFTHKYRIELNTLENHKDSYRSFGNLHLVNVVILTMMVIVIHWSCYYQSDQRCGRLQWYRYFQCFHFQ
jgi:hypothetical protein